MSSTGSNIPISSSPAKKQNRGEYDRLRSLAFEEGRKRDDCFKRSRKARQSGNKFLAKQLSEQGKQYGRKMKKYNRRARDHIFQSNNPPNKSSKTIDLHGLHVHEAEKLLLKRMNEAKAEGKEQLSVIVGKGKHSRNGARIKPAVEKICQTRDLKCRTENKNEGMIVILLEDYEPEDVMDTSEGEVELDNMDDSEDELPALTSVLPRVSNRPRPRIASTPPPSPPASPPASPTSNIPPLHTTQSFQEYLTSRSPLPPPARVLPQALPSRASSSSTLPPLHTAQSRQEYLISDSPPSPPPRVPRRALPPKASSTLPSPYLRPGLSWNPLSQNTFPSPPTYSPPTLPQAPSTTHNHTSTLVSSQAPWAQRLRDLPLLPPIVQSDRNPPPLFIPSTGARVTQQYSHRAYDEEAGQPAEEKKGFWGRLFKPIPDFFAAVLKFCIPRHAT